VDKALSFDLRGSDRGPAGNSYILWDRPRKSHRPVGYINSWACRATSFRLPSIKSQADAEVEFWEGSSHMRTTTQARSDIELE
jgi:hypothetical protein